jgi:hypothetical protein
MLGTAPKKLSSMSCPTVGLAMTLVDMCTSKYLNCETLHIKSELRVRDSTGLISIAMALDSVDALSDDETTIALSPSAGLQQLANAAAAPAPKAKAKAKTVAKPKAVPKSEASPKAATKSQPKPKGVPKAKGLKRPASASGSAGSAMKRPASKQKDPDHVSAGKSMYKKNGVWCIKLSGKEVVRVFWLHLVHVQSAYKHI